MYKSVVSPPEASYDPIDTLQTSRSNMKGMGLENKAKLLMQNNRDNLGVWDAIAIADAKRYNREQSEKRQVKRKKHLELQKVYLEQAQAKVNREQNERN